MVSRVVTTAVIALGVVFLMFACSVDNAEYAVSSSESVVSDTPRPVTDTGAALSGLPAYQPDIPYYTSADQAPPLPAALTPRLSGSDVFKILDCRLLRSPMGGRLELWTIFSKPVISLQDTGRTQPASDLFAAALPGDTVVRWIDARTACASVGENDLPEPLRVRFLSNLRSREGDSLQGTKIFTLSSRGMRLESIGFDDFGTFSASDQVIAVPREKTGTILLQFNLPLIPADLDPYLTIETGDEPFEIISAALDFPEYGMTSFGEEDSALLLKTEVPDHASSVYRLVIRKDAGLFPDDLTISFSVYDDAAKTDVSITPAPDEAPSSGRFIPPDEGIRILSTAQTPELLFRCEGADSFALHLEKSAPMDIRSGVREFREVFFTPMAEIPEYRVDLRPYLSRDGTGSVLLAWKDPLHEGRIGKLTVQVTDLGCDIRIDDRSLTAYVWSMRSGTPVEGASVALLENRTDLLSGRTDDEGIAVLNWSGADFEAGSSLRGEKPAFENIWLRIGFGSDQLDLDPGFLSRQENAWDQDSGYTHVILDRHICSAGDTVLVFGADHISVDEPFTGAVRIALHDEEGTVVSEQQMRVNRRGFFSARLDVPEMTTPGDCRIAYSRLFFRGEWPTVDVPLKVQANNANALDIRLSREQLCLGDAFIVESTPFSADDPEKTLRIKRNLYTAEFQPMDPELESFTFGTKKRRLLQSDEGSAPSMLSLPSTDGFPVYQAIDVSLNTPDGRLRQGSLGSLIPSGAWYIGLKTRSGGSAAWSPFPEAGSAVKLHYVLVTEEGLPLADSLLPDRLWLTMYPDDGRTAQAQQREIVVEGWEGLISLVPDKAGDYRLRLSGEDAAERLIASEIDITFIDPQGSNNGWYAGNLDISAYRTEFRADDSAYLLVKGADSQQDYWLTIESRLPLEQKFIRLGGAFSVIQFPVMEDYAPLFRIRLSAAAPADADTGYPVYDADFIDLPVSPEYSDLFLDARLIGDGDSVGVEIRMDEPSGMSDADACLLVYSRKPDTLNEAMQYSRNSQEKLSPTGSSLDLIVGSESGSVKGAIRYDTAAESIPFASDDLLAVFDGLEIRAETRVDFAIPSGLESLYCLLFVNTDTGSFFSERFFTVFPKLKIDCPIPDALGVRDTFLLTLSVMNRSETMREFTAELRMDAGTLPLYQGETRQKLAVDSGSGHTAVFPLSATEAGNFQATLTLSESNSGDPVWTRRITLPVLPERSAGTVREFGFTRPDQDGADALYEHQLPSTLTGVVRSAAELTLAADPAAFFRILRAALYDGSELFDMPYQEEGWYSENVADPVPELLEYYMSLLRGTGDTRRLPVKGRSGYETALLELISGLKGLERENEAYAEQLDLFFTEGSDGGEPVDGLSPALQLAYCLKAGLLRRNIPAWVSPLAARVFELLNTEGDLAVMAIVLQELASVAPDFPMDNTVMVNLFLDEHDLDWSLDSFYDDSGRFVLNSALLAERGVRDTEGIKLSARETGGSGFFRYLEEPLWYPVEGLPASAGDWGISRDILDYATRRPLNELKAGQTVIMHITATPSVGNHGLVLEVPLFPGCEILDILVAETVLLPPTRYRIETETNSLRVILSEPITSRVALAIVCTPECRGFFPLAPAQGRDLYAFDFVSRSSGTLVEVR